MNTKDVLHELRSLDADKLNSKATTAAEELLKLRFRKKAGQLSQTHHLRRVRKELARVLTVQASKAAKKGE